MRRTPVLVTAVALMATCTAIPSAASQPAPRTPAIQLTAADQQMLAQRPLVEAADRLAKVAQKPGLQGYAGITLTDDAVVLWWKGTPPAQVRRAVTGPIRIASAAHSKAELDAAAQSIEAYQRQHPGHGIDAIKNPGDGSGLVLGVQPTHRAAAALDQTLEQRTGVPIRVVAEEPLKPTSRGDDWSPWIGGARLWNQSAGAICTTGFGVKDGQGRPYILTAAHCGQSGQQFADGTGEYIGHMGARHQDHDIALIPTNAVDFQLYVGDGNSGLVENVPYWGHVYVGQYLCQSGITSAAAVGGPVCNIKVLFFYNDREDLVEGEQMNGQQSARGGDSGGPVYSRGSAGLIANGTVTRSAGPRIGFQDFATANRDFGVAIP
ncbi:hypothetical protein HPO96_09050 [Kribbella sandramycini]|uniref:Streptogrisin C n=1 Tax=Kribbella sandramycini TaxID=60450 RepID=A0A7Y4KYY3_9ACTN|nr:hypothetical protein [Kribbella sandramycini]MBB6569782.1 hypothetical protein [Kribbella sandramycini]NOL40391.1 hypothetical protein [Kribbella sandramycini]